MVWRDTMVHDFKVHRHRAEDATSLSSSVISDIVEDPNGDLWLATNKGVNHFDRKAQVFPPLYS